MISEKYIMKLVKEYAKSPEGQAEIQKKYGVQYREKIPQSELMAYGEKMKQILFAHINPIIKSITMDDIIVEPPVVNKGGRLSMKISFREGSLHRESLYEDGYPEGLSNIVLLFARGYHASDYAYGLWGLPNQTWYGGSGFVSVRSRKDREPNHFLHDAVNEFNGSSGGFAVAKLEEKYQ